MMMAVCDRGHFFNEMTHSSCPYCAVNIDIGVRESSKSAFSLRVFISSTFEDLKQYRQAVFEAIHSLGAHSDDMIYWSADERSGAQASIDRLEKCDVVILLLAHRYGHVPDGCSISITELEYSAARRKKIPVFAYFLDENEPWPPKYIELNRTDEIRAFKNRVSTDVTRRTFRTTDELGRLVTQSLALYMQRHREDAKEANIFPGQTIAVDTSSCLSTDPDATISIGTSEVGLPLLISITRSRDLGPYVQALASVLPSSAPHSDSILSSFRQALEADARKSWAQERLFLVRRADGSYCEMFVTRANLTELFRSTMSLLIAASPTGTLRSTVPFRDPSEWQTRAVAIEDEKPRSPLQSEGGKNRFLGIDPQTGATFSVGMVNGAWVEWRPFYFESVLSSIPSAIATIASENMLETPLSALADTVLQTSIYRNFEGSQFPLSVSISITRQAVALVLADVADRVAEMHSNNILHGDIKPDNLLIGIKGMELIDGFEVAEGDIWPGFTPMWAAPEQVLGEAAIAASDIYPFGRLISELLGGQLVGEVRKFRARRHGGNAGEFDVFYNPAVSLGSRCPAGNAATLSAWRSLARECLRFLPTERPSSAHELGDRIRFTANTHPLEGRISIPVLSEMHIASMPGGYQTVACVLRDI